MTDQAVTSLYRLWGTVSEIAPGRVTIKGLSQTAGIGDTIVIRKNGETIAGEVLNVSGDSVHGLLFSSGETLRIGDQAQVKKETEIQPGDHWLGQIVNFRGEVQSPVPVEAVNAAPRPLMGHPPPAFTRRTLGAALNTGLMATDTLLPICRGQRIGLFAGSGVGKSTLLGTLAGALAADRVVIALIGERSREVNEFVHNVLPKSALERTVIVAATADEPPGAKKRAAFCATAAAEHFRDQGHNVLLLFDSITRFAEAHRETALMVGETPALNAFPPSTVRTISELTERAGPGADGMGDITAVYSVLVAGSDMEEPVADMIRGILDGHIILSREIAERGRYPAIDVLKSVSRALPRATTDDRNALLKEYRRLVALYEEVEPMLRASLYEFGRDPNSDRAIALYPTLDQFAAEPNSGTIDDAYGRLQSLLSANVEVPKPVIAKAG